MGRNTKEGYEPWKRRAQGNESEGNESVSDDKNSKVEEVTHQFNDAQHEPPMPGFCEYEDSSSDEDSDTESEDEGTNANRKKKRSKMRTLLSQIKDIDDESDATESNIAPKSRSPPPEDLNDITEDALNITEINPRKPLSTKKKQKKLTPRKKPPSKKYIREENKDNDEDYKEPPTPFRSAAIRNPVRSPEDANNDLESTPIENNELELNEEEETPLRLEDSGPIGGASDPEHNLLCEAYLNNMRDGVAHEDNEHNRNKNMVTMQLDKKFLSAKNLQ